MSAALVIAALALFAATPGETTQAGEGTAPTAAPAGADPSDPADAEAEADDAPSAAPTSEPGDEQGDEPGDEPGDEQGDEPGDEPSAPSAAPTGDEPQPDPVANENTDSSPSAQPVAPSGDEASTPARPRGPRRYGPDLRGRTTRQLRRAPTCRDPDDPRCHAVPGLGADVMALRPSFLEPRSAFGASLLGFGIGFGTGFYYAGDTTQGVIFTLVDGALWGAFVAALSSFNQLVISNDFAEGVSLARGERSFNGEEENLYTLSWAFAGLVVATHLYQGIGAIFATRKTNAMLENVTVVPLGD